MASQLTARNPNARVWLVTGASSGFGYEVTKHALSRGDKVVATTRNTSSSLLTSLSQTYRSQLLLIENDITDITDIQRVFARVKEVHGKLDVVFSNAGYTLLAEVEGTPEEEARKLFEVNFWGSVHVMQEAVKFFRDVNPKGAGGRIIQNSSASGMYCFPAQGIYSASKHALEAMTETLALELDPAWNIKVTLLQPAMFDTPGRTNLINTPPHPAYTSPTSTSKSPLPSVLTRQYVTMPFPGDTAKAAAAIYKLSELENPPMRLPLGKHAVRLAREKMDAVKKDVDMYEAWSEGLELDGAKGS
ncbi:hypothetical protein QCA50_005052 [Cerrena zonata]|uniref:NAD(P)-binding protein n=1 Tax=Cerrena zonata TaxID=2478898 RepID=A0AAW0GN51_9APHY